MLRPSHEGILLLPKSVSAWPTDSTSKNVSVSEYDNALATEFDHCAVLRPMRHQEHMQAVETHFGPTRITGTTGHAIGGTAGTPELIHRCYHRWAPPLSVTNTGRVEQPEDGPRRRRRRDPRDSQTRSVEKERASSFECSAGVTLRRVAATSNNKYPARVSAAAAC